MKKAIVVYSKVLPEFKREASALLKEHFPGNFKAARSLIYRFLDMKDDKLHRWYNMLLIGWLSATDFIRLFSRLKEAFSLQELKEHGISPEKIQEVTRLIIKLYRAIVICRSGCLESGQADIKTKFITQTLRP
ncbi:MAG TPA: hypothetical protein VGD22_15675 [Sphingobacteriaceae bacterium]